MDIEWVKNHQALGFYPTQGCMVLDNLIYAHYQRRIWIESSFCWKILFFLKVGIHSELNYWEEFRMITTEAQKTIPTCSSSFTTNSWYVTSYFSTFCHHWPWKSVINDFLFIVYCLFQLLETGAHGLDTVNVQPHHADNEDSNDEPETATTHLQCSVDEHVQEKLTKTESADTAQQVRNLTSSSTCRNDIRSGFPNGHNFTMCLS